MHGWGGGVIIQTNYSETLASDHRLCSLPFARKMKNPCGFVMYGKKTDGTDGRREDVNGEIERGRVRVKERESCGSK